MIESPLIQSIVEEARRRGMVELIVLTLEDRFGPAGVASEPCLAQVKDEEKLMRLNVQAVTCPSLKAFEEALHEELPRQPPASTRGRRRARKPE